MDRTKRVKVICLHPNGGISLESIDLGVGSSASFYIPTTNASQGPEFVQSPYTYVLHWSLTDKGEKNIYSERLLHLSCNCGYEDHGTCNGNMYLSKHDPRKRENHKFDFSQEIPFEEISKYDTHIDCLEEDINFVKHQLDQLNQDGVTTWTEWVLRKLGLFGIA